MLKRENSSVNVMEDLEQIDERAEENVESRNIKKRKNIRLKSNFNSRNTQEGGQSSMQKLPRYEHLTTDGS